MNESSQSLTQKIDQLIYDCYHKCTDILIQGRNAIIYPKIKDKYIESAADNSDYCKEILKGWKNNITQPLVIDLYLLDPNGKRFYLLEHWTFYYQRKEDPKECRLNHVNLKIVTLLRTLYSFVRLLPGYQLLNNNNTDLYSISFHVYNPSKLSKDELALQKFSTNEISSYNMPIVNTLKGILSITVRYIDPFVIQEILRPPIPIYTLRRRRSVDREPKRQSFSDQTISKSYESSTNAQLQSYNRKLNQSPDSTGTSYSPSFGTFLLDPGLNVASPLMNHVSNHPLPSADDGLVNLSPPYAQNSLSLVSTSPNVPGFGIQSIMMNLRSSQTAMKSVNNQGNFDIGKLPTSPFDQSVESNQLLVEVNPVIQTAYHTYIKPKNIDKCIDIIIECNRKGLPIDILAMNDDDDDDEAEDIDISEDSFSRNDRSMIRVRTSTINDNSMAFLIPTSSSNNLTSKNLIDDSYDTYAPLTIEPFKRFEFSNGSKSSTEAMDFELQYYNRIRNNVTNKR